MLFEDLFLYENEFLIMGKGQNTVSELQIVESYKIFQLLKTTLVCWWNHYCLSISSNVFVQLCSLELYDCAYVFHNAPTSGLQGLPVDSLSRPFKLSMVQVLLQKLKDNKTSLSSGGNSHAVVQTILHLQLYKIESNTQNQQKQM